MGTKDFQRQISPKLLHIVQFSSTERLISLISSRNDACVVSYNMINLVGFFFYYAK